MKLSLAFWGSDGANEPADIRRQVREWAAAEPNVTACRVLRVHQPYPDRYFWWQADVSLRMREEPAVLFPELQEAS